MEAITFEDRRRHAPALGVKPNWQESFYLGWVDLAEGLAGAHHISLAPEGSSHVWSWLYADGRVLARAQQHDLALPDADLENLTLGALHVRAGETVRDVTLRADFDRAGVELDFRALCDPVVVNFNHGEIILADRHYEALGMAKGVVRLGGRQIPVEAAAWHDHSWGAREFASNPSHRWLFAVFGDDLAFSIFSFVTGSSRSSFGWVFDQGRAFSVRQASFRAVVDDDGMTPVGCQAEIYTDGGRGYEVAGSCLGRALMGGKGWFGVDGITRFTCGGRVGQGFLEVAELKAITPEMEAELGL